MPRPEFDAIVDLETSNVQDFTAIPVSAFSSTLPSSTVTVLSLALTPQYLLWLIRVAAIRMVARSAVIPLPPQPLNSQPVTERSARSHTAAPSERSLVMSHATKWAAVPTPC